MTKSSLRNIGLILAGSLVLWACATPPKQDSQKPTPPPKAAKTYKDVHIGSNNFMTVPSHWNLKQNIMPKGYVSYSIKSRDVHLVITGYEAKKSEFNIAKSKKDLASVTILYRTGSKTKQKRYKEITDQHKLGGYTHHTCHGGNKCYQVFPLSNWRSMMAADFHVGGMKYTLTAGVDDLDGVHAKDILKGLHSIRVKSSAQK
ncbi:hypothetical protein [Kangiella marina]|uniref:Lipoprotein n=1 Tax=Kangiella marina TaxID=1079178 RepID=A0ABP8IBN5_9GAMM